MIKTLSGMLRVLFTPACWTQLNPYSTEWDKQLTKLMQENEFIRIDEFTARLGKFEIWIENHPYRSFYSWEPVLHVRPRRITILRAHDKFMKDTISAVLR